jgi:hypothetical protein
MGTAGWVATHRKPASKERRKSSPSLAGRIHRPEKTHRSIRRKRESAQDEGVWNQLKKRLANGRPESKAELRDVLGEEIRRLASSPQLLRGCIEQSELPASLP